MSDPTLAQALLSLLLLNNPPEMATVSYQSVPMPPAVVLIVCKVESDGPEDQNAQLTGSQNLRWATEHSMMVCRRQEVQLYDQAEASGADAQGFNVQRCQRAGLTLGAQWDAGHRGSKYRFYRVACPVPTIDTNTGNIIAWSMPSCGDRATILCEVDSEI